MNAAKSNLEHIPNRLEDLHWISATEEGETPKFCQLYIHDTENEIQNRMRSFKKGAKAEELDATIVEDLKEMLDRENPIAQLFRMARDRLSAPRRCRRTWTRPGYCWSQDTLSHSISHHATTNVSMKPEKSTKTQNHANFIWTYNWPLFFHSLNRLSFIFLCGPFVHHVL